MDRFGKKKLLSVPTKMHEEGRASSASDLDRAFDKIFHPEQDRFNVSTLNPNEESNVDEGAKFFFSNTETNLASLSDHDHVMSAPEDTNDPTTDNEAVLFRPRAGFFNRSLSMHETPITDTGSQMLKKGDGKLTFQTYMDAIGKEHYADVMYPHAHHVMSRMREHMIKRSESDQHFPNSRQDNFFISANDARGNKRGRKRDLLPTIKDEEVAGDVSQAAKMAAFSIEPIDDAAASSDEDNRRRRQGVKEADLDKNNMNKALSTEKKAVSFTKMAPSSQAEEDDDEDQEAKSRPKQRRRRKHRHVPLEEDLRLRRTRGSELALEHYSVTEPTETLLNRDAEEMAAHRLDYLQGMSRPKIKKASSTVDSFPKVPSLSMDGRSVAKESLGKTVLELGLEEAKTPHRLFIEMDELHGEQWIEEARWIKLCLERGIILLDLELKDLPEIVYRVVEEFSIAGLVEEDQKSDVLRILLFKHKHVDDHHHAGGGHHNQAGILAGIKKNFSQRSLTNMEGGGKSEEGLPKSRTFASSDTEEMAKKSAMSPGMPRVGSHSLAAGLFKTAEGVKSLAEVTTGGVSDTRHGILKKLSIGTEGVIVLVGALDFLKEPTAAFVRLSKSAVMPNSMEATVPVRFVFILLTPKPSPTIDCHEVGRAFSTLMSNPQFSALCYRMEARVDLLLGINQFLDESVVLPPGDWDSKNLLSLSEINDLRRRRRARLEGMAGEEEHKDEKKRRLSKVSAKDIVGVEEGKKEKEKMDDDPLVRTSTPFGGVINDIKRRYPLYLDDIKDGLNAQCFATLFFIYFACLSGAIAFGGLMAVKTNNLIGIPETLIVSAVAGIIFSLLAGQPLIVTGVTGPVLLYDEALFGFTKSLDIDFLEFRVWIGIWLLIISLIVAFFQGSTLVRYFTKFTKDIFASLVSLLFIFEAIRKLVLIFGNHPLLSLDQHCSSHLESMVSKVNASLVAGSLTSIDSNTSDFLIASVSDETSEENSEPNTALLSAILMFGTFFIAYFLRIFRNGKYLGRTVRRSLGDFGVPIGIVLMVLLDFLVNDTYTQKLAVPTGLQVTSPESRGWFIAPFGQLAVYHYLSAAIPALLLYLLLFMETHICELIMMEKTQNRKGCGLHMDIVLLCGINCIGGLFGGPWICAATVRAVAHVSALTVMSTTHAPGEAAKVVDVKDQRVTFFAVSVLLGTSVLLAPVLRHVPFAVLFGVFLYMGVSSINGIQFFDRVSLIFMPVKHHPQVSYVRRVKTWRMNLFTCFQIMGLVVLWVVKSTKLALAFPFFVVAMIPFRWCLSFVFSQRELDALDGPSAGQVVSDDNDKDFYEQAYGA